MQIHKTINVKVLWRSSSQVRVIFYGSRTLEVRFWNILTWNLVKLGLCTHELPVTMLHVCMNNYLIKSVHQKMQITVLWFKLTTILVLPDIAFKIVILSHMCELSMYGCWLSHKQATDRKSGVLNNILILTINEEVKKQQSYCYLFFYYSKQKIPEYPFIPIWHLDLTITYNES